MFDRLPADAVGCYGDPAARTPVLDRLARQGASFRDAHAPSTSGDVCRATLLSGAYPFEHGIRGTGDGAFAPPAETLAEAVAVAELRAVASDPEPDGAVLAGFESGLPTDEAGTPFLAWLRYPGIEYERDALRTLRALETTGGLVRTLVLACGFPVPVPGSLADADLRVPLVAWGPSPFRGGGLRTDPARLLDVYRTSLHALRIGPHYKVSGRALQEVLEAHKRDRVECYAETPVPPGVRRAIRVGRWKLVASDPPQLYDLAADPAERREAGSAHPRVLERLRARLDTLVEDDPLR